MLLTSSVLENALSMPPSGDAALGGGHGDDFSGQNSASTLPASNSSAAGDRFFGRMLFHIGGGLSLSSHHSPHSIPDEDRALLGLADDAPGSDPSPFSFFVGGFSFAGDDVDYVKIEAFDRGGLRGQYRTAQVERDYQRFLATRVSVGIAVWCGISALINVIALGFVPLTDEDPQDASRSGMVARRLHAAAIVLLVNTALCGVLLLVECALLFCARRRRHLASRRLSGLVGIADASIEGSRSVAQLAVGPAASDATEATSSALRAQPSTRALPPSPDASGVLERSASFFVTMPTEMHSRIRCVIATALPSVVAFSSHFLDAAVTDHCRLTAAAFNMTTSLSNASLGSNSTSRGNRTSASPPEYSEVECMRRIFAWPLLLVFFPVILRYPQLRGAILVCLFSALGLAISRIWIPDVDGDFLGYKIVMHVMFSFLAIIVKGVHESDERRVFETCAVLTSAAKAMEDRRTELQVIASMQLPTRLAIHVARGAVAVTSRCATAVIVDLIDIAERVPVVTPKNLIRSLSDSTCRLREMAAMFGVDAVSTVGDVSVFSVGLLSAMSSSHATVATLFAHKTVAVLFTNHSTVARATVASGELVLNVAASITLHAELAGSAYATARTLLLHTHPKTVKVSEAAKRLYDSFAEFSPDDAHAFGEISDRSDDPVILFDGSSVATFVVLGTRVGEAIMPPAAAAAMGPTSGHPTRNPHQRPRGAAGSSSSLVSARSGVVSEQLSFSPHSGAIAEPRRHSTAGGGSAAVAGAPAMRQAQWGDSPSSVSHGMPPHAAHHIQLGGADASSESHSASPLTLGLAGDTDSLAPASPHVAGLPPLQPLRVHGSKSDSNRRRKPSVGGPDDDEDHMRRSSGVSSDTAASLASSNLPRPAVTLSQKPTGSSFLPVHRLVEEPESDSGAASGPESLAATAVGADVQLDGVEVQEWSADGVVQQLDANCLSAGCSQHDSHSDVRSSGGSDTEGGHRRGAPRRFRRKQSAVSDRGRRASEGEVVVLATQVESAVTAEDRDGEDQSAAGAANVLAAPTLQQHLGPPKTAAKGGEEGDAVREPKQPTFKTKLGRLVARQMGLGVTALGANATDGETFVAAPHSTPTHRRGSASAGGGSSSSAAIALRCSELLADLARGLSRIRPAVAAVAPSAMQATATDAFGVPDTHTTSALHFTASVVQRRATCCGLGDRFGLAATEADFNAFRAAEMQRPFAFAMGWTAVFFLVVLGILQREADGDAAWEAFALTLALAAVAAMIGLFCNVIAPPIFVRLLPIPQITMPLVVGAAFVVAAVARPSIIGDDPLYLLLLTTVLGQASTLSFTVFAPLSVCMHLFFGLLLLANRAPFLGYEVVAFCSASLCVSLERAWHTEQDWREEFAYSRLHDAVLEDYITEGKIHRWLSRMSVPVLLPLEERAPTPELMCVATFIFSQSGDATGALPVYVAGALEDVDRILTQHATRYLCPISVIGDMLVLAGPFSLNSEAPDATKLASPRGIGAGPSSGAVGNIVASRARTRHFNRCSKAIAAAVAVVANFLPVFAAKEMNFAVAITSGRCVWSVESECNVMSFTLVGPAVTAGRLLASAAPPSCALITGSCIDIGQQKLEEALVAFKLGIGDFDNWSVKGLEPIQVAPLLPANAAGVNNGFESGTLHDIPQSYTM